MTTITRYRALTILCAALSGALLSWQASIADFALRVFVAGAGGALGGAALLFYGQAIRRGK